MIKNSVTATKPKGRRLLFALVSPIVRKKFVWENAIASIAVQLWESTLDLLSTGKMQFTFFFMCKWGTSNFFTISIATVFRPCSFWRGVTISKMPFSVIVKHIRPFTEIVIKCTTTCGKRVKTILDHWNEVQYHTTPMKKDAKEKKQIFTEIIYDWVI